jgi:hypothetical protein
MPTATVSNSTCFDNNCGFVEQLDPRKKAVQPSTSSQCTNASLKTVWSCVSGTCSDLYHGMIAPFVNVTIAGAIWYQGENNIAFGAGSIAKRSGYACQQASMIASWRAAFSAVDGTTDPTFPFGKNPLLLGT